MSQSILVQLVDKFGEVQDGNESVLTEDSFDILKEFVCSVYGEDIAEKFESCWTQREDGSMVVSDSLIL